MGSNIDLNSLSEATSGAIGALVSTTVLYPLDTCKTKYQAEVRVQGHQRYRDKISMKSTSGYYHDIPTKELEDNARSEAPNEGITKIKY
ncbi:peroxisomal adenine nucleotide carrier 2-like isoform X1 [Papaver somniferum]|uniref:peroxisomal adenine nucleotide carrier 2-like isoform X1 n=1 Tax=Papaver somniferum TaxID=3469 RepID=UPI000E6FB40D|nr:peroxisomal adenine nucleotide carrier 2-like isoform X1 [Papaver somniferum]